MRTTISVCSALLLTGAVSAQLTNVLPSANATTPSNWNSTMFFSTTSATTPRESRTQVLYDAADVVNSGIFLSLAVRRPSQLGNANVATTVNLQIDMSMSPVGYLSASPTYANNHGVNVVTVFNGPVNLSAISNGPFPQPWEATIPFTAPFPFIAAATQSLCAEFISTNSSATQTWYVEGAAAITGAGSFDNHLTNTTCLHSGNAANNAISWSGQPTVGTTWGPVTFQNLPENNPSWNANAMLCGLQGTGGNIGGLPLPLLISSLGLVPSDPRCVLANDIVWTLPLTYNTSATVNRGTLVQAPITFPNDPTMAGFVFFQQPLALDIDLVTQTPRLWTGWARRSTIGDGVRRGLPLTQIARTGANSNPTGTIATHTGPTLLINL
jgi:hypothetical protein